MDKIRIGKFTIEKAGGGFLRVGDIQLAPFVFQNRGRFHGKAPRPSCWEGTFGRAEPARRYFRVTVYVFRRWLVKRVFVDRETRLEGEGMEAFVDASSLSEPPFDPCHRCNPSFKRPTSLFLPSLRPASSLSYSFIIIYFHFYFIDKSPTCVQLFFLFFLNSLALACLRNFSNWEF